LHERSVCIVEAKEGISSPSPLKFCYAFDLVSSSTPSPSYKEYAGFALGGIIQYKLYGSEEQTAAAYEESVSSFWI
jgi:hypothetical protein